MIFISCSNNDDSPNSNNFNFSLNNGNYWTYNVLTENTASRDSLYIKGDTIINNKTYKKFKAKDFPSGFYSTSLNNNGLRKDGSKLLLSGTLGFGANQGLPTSISIDLNDFIIFNGNASSGTTMGTKNGTIQETFGDYNVVINYTLTSKSGDFYDVYNVNGNDYENVKATEISLRMTINASLVGVPFSIPVLQNQEVLHSNQYTANQIGVIKTETTISYNIDSQIASTLGIPASSVQNQSETLDTYFFN